MGNGINVPSRIWKAIKVELDVLGYEIKRKEEEVEEDGEAEEEEKEKRNNV